jgi:hypothetical protein
MSELKRIYYFNSLFDLELGKFPVNKIQQSSAEMGVLFAPLGSRQDRILLGIDVPDEYWYHLDACGLSTPQPLSVSEKVKDFSGFEGEAWGWNQRSLDILSKTGAHCFLPETCIIEKVNSRCFNNNIAEKHELGVAGSRYSCNPYDYREILLSLNNDFPLVIKPAYGGCGFGFRIIKTPDLSDNYFNDIAFLSEHGGYVIEPWHKRVYDLSTRVEIDRDGSVSLLRHLRPYVNSFGAFYGIYLSPQDPVLKEYDKVLEDTAIKISKELYSEGYWGPAGLDSFVYKDFSTDSLKVASVIEVNARHVMSDIAFALRNSCAPGKYCFFRFISRKKGTVPDDYKSLNNMLGPEMFNPLTKTGIMLVSPLMFFFNNNWVKPSQNVFFISADSEAELFNRDNRLRELLRKTV